MISDPKHGWCNFKLRTFEGTPSYLTDVPVDLLEAFYFGSISDITVDSDDEESTL